MELPKPKLFADLKLDFQAGFLDFSVRTMSEMQKEAQKRYQDVLAEEKAAAEAAAAEIAKPEFVRSDIGAESAIQLANVNGETVCAYVEKMYEGFEEARKLRAAQIKHLEAIRTRFHAFLRRENGEKKREVQEIQKAINNLPQDMRFDEECKAELSQRTEDHVSFDLIFKKRIQREVA